VGEILLCMDSEKGHFCRASDVVSGVYWWCFFLQQGIPLDFYSV
jgi:hypothetical protein